MPYHWLPQTETPPGTRHLRLWPHRSLPPKGFVWFIALTAGLIAMPLVAVLATPVFWGLLPFVAAALAALWWGLRRSHADRAVIEDLTLAPDGARLIRRGPRGRVQEWHANPHWVEVRLHPSGGPVPAYLTLRGNGREVEIGAFLSEDERRALHPELRAAFAAMRGPGAL